MPSVYTVTKVHFNDSCRSIFQFVLELIAAGALVAIANYWLVFPTLLLTVFLYFLRYTYNGTMQSGWRLADAGE